MLLILKWWNGVGERRGCAYFEDGWLQMQGYVCAGRLCDGGCECSCEGSCLGYFRGHESALVLIFSVLWPSISC